LQYAYPLYEWDLSKFSKRKKKSSQRWLLIQLRKLLPESLLFEDFLHPSLRWANASDSLVELDVWIPQFNLALEYQGTTLTSIVVRVDNS